MHPEALIEHLNRTKRDGLTVAFDGRCASGKTTCAHRLEQSGFSVVHADHFFLPPRLRIPERLSTPGGNIDSERFLLEVIRPLAEGRDIIYHIFSCTKMDFDGSVFIKSGSPLIIEGVYCLHPAFGSYYSEAYFFDVDKEEQLRRLAMRCPDKLKDFKQKWIPMEERYFSAFGISNNTPVR